MKKQGIVHHLFHQGMSFERLKEHLSTKKWDAYQAEDWFQRGIMRVWIRDGMPKLDANETMRFFGHVSDSLAKSIFSILGGTEDEIELNVNDDLNHKLKAMDTIYLRLEYDDAYRLSKELLKTLVEIRLGAYPANIHPIFERMADTKFKHRYMNKEYLGDLTGIKDSRRRKVFNYSQAGRTFEIHAHTDWNRLFGECDTDMEQMLRDIDPKSEESELLKKKYNEWIDTNIEKKLEEWRPRTVKNRALELIKEKKDEIVSMKFEFLDWLKKNEKIKDEKDPFIIYVAKLLSPSNEQSKQEENSDLGYSLLLALKNAGNNKERLESIFGWLDNCHKDKATLKETTDYLISIAGIKIVDNPEKCEAYTRGLIEDNSGVQKELLLALKRATDHRMDIDAIVESCYDNYAAYHNSESCLKGQEERFLGIASTYGELPLSIRGQVKAREKEFFKKHAKNLRKLILDELKNALPDRYKKSDPWEEGSKSQQAFIDDAVFKVLKRRYRNDETAKYIKRQLGEAKWLSQLLVELDRPQLDESTNTVEFTFNDDKLYFSEIQQRMSSENNKSSMRCEMVKPEDSVIDEKKLYQLMHRDESMTDEEKLALTPEQRQEWAKMEILEDLKLKAIEQKKYYILTKEQLNALAEKDIGDIAQEKEDDIARFIDEIARSSGYTENKENAFIDKLIHYMFQNKVEKLLPVMMPYLHRINRITFDNDPFKENNECMIGQYKLKKLKPIDHIKYSYEVDLTTKQELEIQKHISEALEVGIIKDICTISDDSFIKLIVELLKKDDVKSMHKLLNEAKSHPSLLMTILLAKDKYGFTSTPILWAIRNEKNRMARVLLRALSSHPDILMEILLAKGPKVWTALHEAVIYGNKNMISMLLKAGKNTGTLQDMMLAKGEYGDIPIHWAVVRSSVDILAQDNDKIVSKLLEACSSDHALLKCMLMEKDNRGWTALHRSVVNINLAAVSVRVVSELLKAGKDTGTLQDMMLDKNEDGDTPIHLAAARFNDTYHENVDNELLNVGFSDHALLRCVLMAKNNRGSTALHVAVKKRNNNMISKLLEACSSDYALLKSMLMGKDNRGYTALHVAVKNSNNNMISKLLKAGKDTGTLQDMMLAKDKYGCTPIHFAAAWTFHKNMANKLLEAGFLDHALLKCMLMEKNKRGSTALHLAVKNSNNNMISRLLEACSSDHALLKSILMEKDNLGSTALHLAVRMSNEKMISKLCEAACSSLDILLEMPWTNGTTLLDFILDRGCYDENILLLKDDKENTILHYAIKNGNEKAINTLFDAAAAAATTLGATGFELLKKMLSAEDEDGKTSLNLIFSTPSESSSKIISTVLDAAMNTPMLLRYILNDNYFMKERLNDDYHKNYLFISSISLNETGWARAEMIMSLLNGPDEEKKSYLKKSLLDMVNEFDGKETKLGSFDDDHAKKMLYKLMYESDSEDISFLAKKLIPPAMQDYTMRARYMLNKIGCQCSSKKADREDTEKVSNAYNTVKCKK